MNTRVFVGGLTYRVGERDIEKFFRKCGRIREIAMKNGFAFVEFDDYRDAEDAVYEMNGKELLGERVSVERARGTPRGSDRGGGGRGYSRTPRSRSSRDDDSYQRGGRYGPPTRTDYRVLVENLSSRISWQDLKDYMRRAGEACYADAHKQRRNEGVVEFASYADMKNAIEKLDGAELNGRRIRISEDKRRGAAGRKSRSSSRSRSRSRGGGYHRRSKSQSRSRSRSRSRRSSHSRSKSRDAASKSRSRSRSNVKRSKSRSQSKDRSRSNSMNGHRDKSNSRSPVKENNTSDHND